MRKRRKNIVVVKEKIDYEKLAKAIVEANRKTEEEPPVDEPDEKISFWRAAWYIITNEKQSDGTLTTGLFSLLLSSVFNLLAFTGVVASVAFGVAICRTVTQLSNEMRFVLVFIGVLLILLLLLFSLVLRGVANEIEKEKDRNYILALFASVVSFAALVVALISLLKGVG